VSGLVDNPMLARIPGQAMTKKQYDEWVANTGRSFTDPWMSLHHSSRPGYLIKTDTSVRNKKELVS
jgi:hypothetical protein